MSYIVDVMNMINESDVGMPIYTADLAEHLMKMFSLDKRKAKAAVSVAMKRIMDKELNPKLRFYHKGIYYITEKTAFGEMGIDKESLIRRKYLYPDKGYETGYTTLYRMGLTTQLPCERVIATNAAIECVREDKKLGVFIKPPKIQIKSTNKMYLQLLDVVDLFDKAPIDSDDPYKLIADHIDNNELRYDKLLAIADRYYNRNTIIQLAHIAAVRGAI